MALVSLLGLAYMQTHNALLWNGYLCLCTAVFSQYLCNIFNSISIILLTELFSLPSTATGNRLKLLLAQS